MKGRVGKESVKEGHEEGAVLGGELCGGTQREGEASEVREARE